MFGSVILEVGIGLILTFLLFSIILTSAQEGIEALLKQRAKDLERAIGELLDKGANASIVKDFYEHPMIYPLFKGSYDAANGKVFSSLPSYIPKANFAAAVADIANKAAVAAPSQTNTTALTPTQRVLDAYQIANTVTRGGAASALTGLESWYDSAMDRASGLYKRKTLAWLFVIGFLAAAIGNINPITIGDSLAKDQKLRADLVALAPALQEKLKVEDGHLVCTADAKGAPKECATSQSLANHITDDLTGAGLPIGWGKDKSIWGNIKNGGCLDWKSIAGWIITALAGMLGAPFWFDLLNKFMNFRSALKPDQPKK
jgi:hypothetical protein